MAESFEFWARRTVQEHAARMEKLEQVQFALARNYDAMQRNHDAQMAQLQTILDALVARGGVAARGGQMK